jgi:uncharacterized membrane protein YhdT
MKESVLPLLFLVIAVVAIAVILFCPDFEDIDLNNDDFFDDDGEM